MANVSLKEFWMSISAALHFIVCLLLIFFGSLRFNCLYSENQFVCILFCAASPHYDLHVKLCCKKCIFDNFLLFLLNLKNKNKKKKQLTVISVYSFLSFVEVTKSVLYFSYLSYLLQDMW